MIQTEKECYISHRTDNLESHHIFGGSNRKLSEKYKLKVWLTHDWHNEPPYGVHHNKELMQKLHEVGQRYYEEHYGTREDFLREFGRNYLDNYLEVVMKKVLICRQVS